MENPDIVNAAAVAVAVLTQRMTAQYFAHVASMYVARHPAAESLAPPVEHGQIVPIIRVPRRDGNDMILWFNHYLKEANSPNARSDFDKVWLQGALLTVGDALGANGYFGHCPEAEIIRHLRNGISHGNLFNFQNAVLDRATGKLRYPANIFRYADIQKMPRHFVDSELQGQEVLWNWGGPDAIMDCLIVLGVHLWNVGYGLPIPSEPATTDGLDVLGN